MSQSNSYREVYRKSLLPFVSYSIYLDSYSFLGSIRVANSNLLKESVSFGVRAYILNELFVNKEFEFLEDNLQDNILRPLARTLKFKGDL